jgi:NitT/TauT family transport system substrate-binding protein
MAALLLVFVFSTAEAEDNRKVRIAYSAFSVAFLNLFIAENAGLFKKHGMDVELIQMAGPLPVAALVAGEIDYLTGFTTGLVAAAQGAPLKGIMVTMRKPPFYIVAQPAIQTPADLAGKRVGVDRIGSLQHLVARLFLKVKEINPEKVSFIQTGSVSNTVTSLGQGAVAAALLSGPHNVIMTQKGFRQIGGADELPVHFPTSGLVVNNARLKSDAERIKITLRVLLESLDFSRTEKARVVAFIREKWKLDGKIAEEVYGQWLPTLATNGKIEAKDTQEYFDLAYSYNQIPAPVQVAAVTDYTLLDQVLKENPRRPQ